MPKNKKLSVDQSIGAKIKIRREDLKKSQADLAKCLDVSFQQIQKYENGANRITASKLFDVAIFLDVSISYFYNDLEPCGINASPVPIDEIAKFSRSSKGRTLIQSFLSIPDEKIRDQLLDLVKVIAKTSI